MRYFSGFALGGEAGLFDEIIAPYKDNPYVVAGFSYGAVKAVEQVYGGCERVERLILLSPAYFAGRGRAFVKTQMIHFRKDRAVYLEKFLENASYPAQKSLLERYRADATVRDLEELLTYPWSVEKLREIERRGTKIETYLGAKDKIVDAEAAHDFFKNFGDSYLFKEYGHILRGGEKGG